MNETRTLMELLEQVADGDLVPLTARTGRLGWYRFTEACGTAAALNVDGDLARSIVEHVRELERLCGKARARILELEAARSLRTFAQVDEDRLPMQPVVLDITGEARFRANEVILGLLTEHGITHKRIKHLLSDVRFSENDRMQFAQLVGFTVDGYGALPFVTMESCKEAQLRIDMIEPKEAAE